MKIVFVLAALLQTVNNKRFVLISYSVLLLKYDCIFVKKKLLCFKKKTEKEMDP